jgi:hypothetical protein
LNLIRIDLATESVELPIQNASGGSVTHLDGGGRSRDRESSVRLDCVGLPEIGDSRGGFQTLHVQELDGTRDVCEGSEGQRQNESEKGPGIHLHIPIVSERPAHVNKIQQRIEKINRNVKKKNPPQWGPWRAFLSTRVFRLLSASGWAFFESEDPT